jgi:hypothetical protein
MIVKQIEVFNRAHDGEPNELICSSFVTSTYAGMEFAPVLFRATDGWCAGRYFAEVRRWVSLQGKEYTSKNVTHWAYSPQWTLKEL